MLLVPTSPLVPAPPLAELNIEKSEDGVWDAGVVTEDVSSLCTAVPSSLWLAKPQACFRIANILLSPRMREKSDEVNLKFFTHHIALSS
jgi:hypothetical protein